jgi:hypothetical protein
MVVTRREEHCGSDRLLSWCGAATLWLKSQTAFALFHFNQLALQDGRQHARRAADRALDHARWSAPIC